MGTALGVDLRGRETFEEFETDKGNGAVFIPCFGFDPTPDFTGFAFIVILSAIEWEIGFVTGVVVAGRRRRGCVNEDIGRLGVECVELESLEFLEFLLRLVAEGYRNGAC